MAVCDSHIPIFAKKRGYLGNYRIGWEQTAQRMDYGSVTPSRHRRGDRRTHNSVLSQYLTKKVRRGQSLLISNYASDMRNSKQIEICLWSACCIFAAAVQANACLPKEDTDVLRIGGIPTIYRSVSVERAERLLAPTTIHVLGTGVNCEVRDYSIRSRPWEIIRLAYRRDVFGVWRVVFWKVRPVWAPGLDVRRVAAELLRCHSVDEAKRQFGLASAYPKLAIYPPGHVSATTVVHKWQWVCHSQTLKFCSVILVFDEERILSADAYLDIDGYVDSGGRADW